MCPTQLVNTAPLTNAMQDLHNNYLLQQSQQQLLLGHLSQLQAAQQSVLPALLPLYQQQTAQLHPALSPLMDNWASSSEADLSKSLSQYSDNQITKIEPLDIHNELLDEQASLPIITSRQASSLLGPEGCVASGHEYVLSAESVDIFNQFDTWPGVKTEVVGTSYSGRCVNPMEVTKQPESSRGTPEDIVSGTESGKLPSLWSGLGRMPWIGFGDRDPSEWLDLGCVREVPEQNDPEDDISDINYDKLL